MDEKGKFKLIVQVLGTPTFESVQCVASNATISLEKEMFKPSTSLQYGKVFSGARLLHEDRLRNVLSFQNRLKWSGLQGCLNDVDEHFGQ